MGKSTISMVIFNSKLLVYQGVMELMGKSRIHGINGLLVLITGDEW